MLRMELSQNSGFPKINADFPDEPQPRRSLLGGVISDMWNQEDLYLSEIARAEAGATVLNLYNNQVSMQLYPDGRVIIYDLNDDSDDRVHTEMTLAEVKQLILDWLAAQAKWQAEHGPLNDGTVPDSR